MRIWVTGGRGFVGSNVVRVLRERHGAAVFAPSRAQLDLTDADAVRAAAVAARPDAVVHAAIVNDRRVLVEDRRAAWAGYVEATRNVVDAANAAGAHVVLVSTDWVFDGTQGGAPEGEPPNPINAYGFLKAASELVVLERAERGTVARIAGVQGVHWARPQAPRRQDAGFGYLVASLVDDLRAGRPFTVWDGPAVNELATPTLASDAAELMWRAIEREATGILHCCGGESLHRVELAQRALAAFDLDPELLRTGPPDDAAFAGGAVPRDTRLDATATAAALGVELPGVDALLARLRAEIETGDIARLEAA